MDFEAAGYEGPADWARLYDLLPSSVTKKELEELEGAGETKTSLMALLQRHGVNPDPAYDPQAAAERNS